MNAFYTRHAALAVLALGIASVVTGCMTTGRAMPTAQQLLDTGQIPENVDHDELYRGRALAMTACVDCHRAYFPQEFHANRWPYIIDDMGERSHLSAQQIRDLRAYMVAAAKAAPATARETEATPEIEPEEPTDTE